MSQAFRAWRALATWYLLAKRIIKNYIVCPGAGVCAEHLGDEMDQIKKKLTLNELMTGTPAEPMARPADISHIAPVPSKPKLPSLAELKRQAKMSDTCTWCLGPKTDTRWKMCDECRAASRAFQQRRDMYMYSHAASDD